MNPLELRIGNLVTFSADSVHVDDPTIDGLKIHTISQLCEDVAFFDESIVGEYYRFIKPIPLTKEWSERFGFSVAAVWASIYTCGLYVHLYIPQHGDFYVRVGDSADPGKCILVRSIKHVHQLQNIHFFLTGTELEITA